MRTPPPEREGELDDESDLATDLVQGSTAALAEMYRRWSTLIYTVAVRSLGEPADAEDVTQQVFVSAWHSRHTLSPGCGSPAAWLLGITKHRIADVHAERARHRRNVTAVASRVEAPARAPDDGWAERLLLLHEIAHMGEPRGTILRLALLEDRTHQDVATTLGLPLGTVKAHVRRGLLLLRRTLGEGDDDAP